MVIIKYIGLLIILCSYTSMIALEILGYQGNNIIEYILWIGIIIYSYTKFYINNQNDDAKYFENEKVDRGFELNYYKLTYRRRFYRTLLLLVIAVIIGIIFTIILEEIKNIIIYWVICLIGIPIQLFYNLYKWKKLEVK